MSLKYADCEVTETVTFSSASSMGLSIEANVVNKAGKKGSQVVKLKVGVGWVMGEVNGQFLPRDKPGILAIVKAATAEAKAGDQKIVIIFRCPKPNSSPPFTYCPTCNNFKPESEFEPEQLDVTGTFGPGKQKCMACNG